MQNPEEARPKPCPLGVRNRLDLRRFEPSLLRFPAGSSEVSSRLPAKPSRPIGLPRTEVPGWFSEGWAPPLNRALAEARAVAPVARVDQPKSIRAVLSGREPIELMSKLWQTGFVCNPDRWLIFAG